MYSRLLESPQKTSFLFGPRGTGKSTWIEQRMQGARVFDLLDTTLALEWERDPQGFRRRVLAESDREQWIIVDEIQKVPRLLDEVHFLIEKKKYTKFLLTGSSSRKLRKSSANLLGGRARVLKFFPLLSQELAFDFISDELIQYGSLPTAIIEEHVVEKEAYLQSYLETYLVDEIKRETQIKNLAGFQRFLEIAAICSAQPVNLSNIAREAQVGRESVKSYFEVLEDTLIGFWLPSYRKRVKVKEVATSKFYFFDSGVLNVTAGFFKQPAPLDWKGVLFETWIVNEVRAYTELYKIKGSLGYWRNHSGTEVDLVWWYGDKVVLIEIKSSKKFRTDYLKGIKSFCGTTKSQVAAAVVVYLGEEELLVEGVPVLPAKTFLKNLFAGELLRWPI